MLYYTQSQYYNWFLVANKKQRAKVEDVNAKQEAKAAANDKSKNASSDA